MKKLLPSQQLEKEFFSLATQRAPLSEAIRLGAQWMLQKAVELEVSQFLGRDHYERSGNQILRGYRNGYEDKRVQGAEGTIPPKMPQVRETLEAFGKARTRSAALAFIDSKLDLGNGLTLKSYTDQIETVQSDLDEYNGLLSQVDATRSKLDTDERQLADLSEKMLIGVAYKYGKDSDEYEKAGGTRKSERRRPSPKAKAVVA